MLMTKNKSKPKKPLSVRKLPSVWAISKKSFDLIINNYKIFLGIALIYGLLTLVLVKGFSGGLNVSTLKTDLNQVFSGNFGALASGLGVFVVMIGSAGSNSTAASSPYQLVIAIITSLAVIWSLRQVLANKKFRLRDTYYKSMYPLIPFILVLAVVSLQLIPLMIGSTIYGMVVSFGIAVSIIERIIWVLVFLGLAALTIYWLSSSLFALYIVTLPDMTPIKALRSAKELVTGYRWQVIRKVIALPVILLLVAIVVMLPIIVILTPLAQWVFFLLTSLVLVAINTYMYLLYRELMNE